MTEFDASFRVLGFRTVALLPDGTERRNSHIVDIKVDGIVHQISLRQNGVAYLPLELGDHPQGAQMKAAALKVVHDALLADVVAERRRRGQPI